MKPHEIKLDMLFGSDWTIKYPFIAETLTSKLSSEIIINDVYGRYTSFFGTAPSGRQHVQGKEKLVRQFEKFLIDFNNTIPTEYSKLIYIYKVDGKDNYFTEVGVFTKFKLVSGTKCNIKYNDLESKLIVVEKYTQLLRSAKSRNLEFNLTLSDVHKLLSRKTCFYSKKKFVLIHNHPLNKTIDRKNPNLGYIKGNVVTCTNEMNRLKEKLFEHKNIDLQAVQIMLNILTTK